MCVSKLPCMHGPWLAPGHWAHSFRGHWVLDALGAASPGTLGMAVPPERKGSKGTEYTFVLNLPPEGLFARLRPERQALWGSQGGRGQRLLSSLTGTGRGWPGHSLRISPRASDQHSSGGQHLLALGICSPRCQELSEGVGPSGIKMAWPREYSGNGGAKADLAYQLFKEAPKF